MERRSFLKRGLLGGALLLGAGWVAFPARGSFEAKWLSGRGAAVLAAVASRVVPKADAAVVVGRIDASLAGAPAELRRDLGRLLLLFESGVFNGRLTPFSWLGDEAKDRALRGWRDSDVAVKRSGYQVLRRLCLNAHYGDRATHLALGYPGPRPTGGMSYDDSKVGT